MVPDEEKSVRRIKKFKILLIIMVLIKELYRSRMVRRDVVNDEEKAAVIIIIIDGTGVEIDIEIIDVARRPLSQGKKNHL